MSSITFTIIKPDAFGNGHTGLILNHIIKAGFKIKGMKLIHMKLDEAKEFYRIHAGRPFYEELTTFMSSGPAVVAVLQKENAVADFRTLIGATNPDEAKVGTIRKLYAENLGRNAVHGSDNDNNAQQEVHFFFTEKEFV